MKKNHLFSIITAGMLTITLLAGCGNTGSNANADTGSNTNTVQESTEDQASAVPESEAQITGEGQNGETIIVTDVRGEVEIAATVISYRSLAIPLWEPQTVMLMTIQNSQPILRIHYRELKF